MRRLLKRLKWIIFICAIFSLIIYAGTIILLDGMNIIDAGAATGSSSNINTAITDDAAKELAKRSRKTPRIANNLLKRIVDFTIYENSKKITKQILNNAFAMLKIDKDGLRKEDIDILKLMFKKFKNVPISLEVIASYIGENVNNIRDVYESYLVNEGYIERTKRGRILTLKGIKKCEEVLLNDDF